MAYLTRYIVGPKDAFDVDSNGNPINLRELPALTTALWIAALNR